jgi:RNA polymerase sigma-70 factor, ECF subfamily
MADHPIRLGRRIRYGDSGMPDGRFESSSDSALVIAVARRSEPALEELCRRYSGQLAGLARRVIRDDELAADVVQDVFVRLWERPERFDPERGSLRSYLLADVHGRSVDLIRAEEARRRREERDHVERLRDPVPTVEDEVVIRGLSADVRESLALLSDDERRAIELAYFDGHSYRDVAILLEEPEGTVKSRIRSGLAKLRSATMAVMVSFL